MSVLASALTESMTSSQADLVVFDRAADSWLRYPWPEVYGRAQAFATHVLDDDGARDVGVVGEPTVDVVAAVVGALLAGAGVSVLPGMVRGADPRRWADTALHRFAGIDGHPAHRRADPRGGAGQHWRVDPAVRNRRVYGRRLLVAAAVSRHGPGDVVRRRSVGCAVLAGAGRRVRRVTVPLVELAQRERGHDDRRTQLRL